MERANQRRSMWKDGKRKIKRCVSHLEANDLLAQLARVLGNRAQTGRKALKLTGKLVLYLALHALILLWVNRVLLLKILQLGLLCANVVHNLLERVNVTAPTIRPETEYHLHHHGN